MGHYVPMWCTLMYDVQQANDIQLNCYVDRTFDPVAPATYCNGIDDRSVFTKFVEKGDRSGDYFNRVSSDWTMDWSKLIFCAIAVTSHGVSLSNRKYVSNGVVPTRRSILIGTLKTTREKKQIEKINKKNCKMLLEIYFQFDPISSDKLISEHPTHTTRHDTKSN